jgi:hypothetical protein
VFYDCDCTERRCWRVCIWIVGQCQEMGSINHTIDQLFQMNCEVYNFPLFGIGILFSHLPVTDWLDTRSYNGFRITLSCEAQIRISWWDWKWGIFSDSQGLHSIQTSKRSWSEQCSKSRYVKTENS